MKKKVIGAQIEESITTNRSKLEVASDLFKTYQYGRFLESYLRPLREDLIEKIKRSSGDERIDLIGQLKTIDKFVKFEIIINELDRDFKIAVAHK